MIDERFPNWDIDVEKGKIWSLRLSRYIGIINKDGYVKVRAPKGYKHKGVHQYIWMVANGCDIPNGYDVHHIDGNKQNNSIYNLELIERHKHLSEHKQNMSTETKKKIGKSHKGKYLSEEHRRKLSESHKGFKHSKESKEKISKAQINNLKKSKKVMQLTLDGELVKIWCSAAECKRNGFSQGNISSCCNGERKQHKGYIWKYYNEERDVA